MYLNHKALTDLSQIGHTVVVSFNVVLVAFYLLNLETD